jgi:dipeptidyl aminopeptidase/acylaminoacyl peptidase
MTCFRATLVVLACAIPLAGARPNFTPDDLWSHHIVSEPRIRGDGTWAVYVDTWNDRARNAAWSNLWAASTDGKSHRRLTEGEWRDAHPRWSPDGTRLAWTSQRGKVQIRVRSFDGNQEQLIAELDTAPAGLAWSPAGDRLAFTTPVAASGTSAWAPASLLPQLLPAPPVRPTLFVVSLSGGPARRLCEASGEPAWMPDGKSLVFARDGQICRISAEGGEISPLTRQPGRHENPVPSPDGSRIAWLATDQGERSYAVRKLHVMNADGSRSKPLSGSLDRDANYPQWSSDSRTVYFLADDAGTAHVYAAHSDGVVRQVTRAPVRLTEFSLADEGTAVSVRTSPQDAGSVVTFAVDRPSALNALAEPNAHLLAERDIAPVEEIHYDSSGRSIQGWLFLPPGFDAARKYPLLLLLRDDPRGMWGNDFNFDTQVFAGKGFAVLCVNPRGTPGYGENFGELLRSRYPGDDFDDLLRGVDFVGSRPYVDRSRISIAGGLLAAWAIGHSDLFHRAVAIRPSFRRNAEWMGMPWQDPEQYVKHLPIFFARNFKTPTLVIGEPGDDESEALFHVLEARHLETAFLLRRLPPDPAGRVAELEAVAGWLGR